MNVGDVVAQQYVERKGMENHDTSRTMRMAVFGGCFAGPVLGNWYRFLELNVKGSTPIKGKGMFIICIWYLVLKMIIISIGEEGGSGPIPLCSCFYRK